MSVEILSKIEADLRAKLGKDENFVLGVLINKRLLSFIEIC
jgi:hypothetical protein